MTANNNPNPESLPAEWLLDDEKDDTAERVKQERIKQAEDEQRQRASGASWHPGATKG